MRKFDCVFRTCTVFFRAVLYGRLNFEDLVYSCRRCRRLGEKNDKVRNNDKRKRYLRHIVYESDDLTLREPTGINSDTAVPYDSRNGKVKNNIGERIEECGKPSHTKRNVKIIVICLVKALLLRVLTGESTDNSYARKSLTGNERDAVELFLNDLVILYRA